MKPKADPLKRLPIYFGIGYAILFIWIAAASSAMASDSRLTFLQAMAGAGKRILDLRIRAFIPASPKFMNNLGLATLIYGVVCLLIYLYYQKNKNMAPGQENGSAKWNTDLAGYNKKYTYPYGKSTKSYENNVILTQDVFLGTDGRQTRRNLHTLVIGGSGAGKSRFYVKPNLLQIGTNSSYVITDPSGELLESCGTFLEQNGYKISVLNLTNMSASYCYNPFEYIRKEEDVLVLINCLIKNTTPPGSSKGDPFWEKSETALLTAIFFYLKYHRPEEDQTFASVMKLLRAANIDENDGSAQSPLDVIFEEIGQDNPNDLGYKSYMTFRMGAGKTLKSILISCAVRLNAFEIPAVAALVRHDYEHPDRNINLSKIGFEKTALFCILPQADDTYNFIVSMMYYQLFESLYYLAEHEPGGLKYNVRFMLDEFCNIGQIPDFDKKLATMRKYGLACSIIIQNVKQLEEMYDKKTEGLIGNCDSILFLGSSEYGTLEFVSKKLGDATIVVRNTSTSRGRSGSSSMSYNRTARKLMTPDECGRIGEENCILFIRDLQPFFGKKYEITKHPNYKYTGDANDDYKYDVAEKFKVQDEPVKQVTKEEQAEEKKPEEVEPQKVVVSGENVVDKVKGFFSGQKKTEVTDTEETAVEELATTEPIVEETIAEDNTPEPLIVDDTLGIVPEKPAEAKKDDADDAVENGNADELLAFLMQGEAAYAEEKAVQEETVAKPEETVAEPEVPATTESRVIDHTHSAIKRKNKTLADLKKAKTTEQKKEAGVHKDSSSDDDSDDDFSVTDSTF